MSAFFLGVASSLAAVFIVWLLGTRVWPDLQRRLFSNAPNIRGVYDLIKMSYDDPKVPDPQAAPKRVELKQSGSKVSGTVSLEQAGEKCRLVGHITASRILTFSYEPEDKNIHDYGSAVLRLSRDGDHMSGVFTFLCNCCEDVTPTRVVMRKKPI
jgi:hypothetical protein